MKKIIVSLAIVVIAAMSANAQQPDPSMQQKHQQPFRHRGQGRDMIAKKLNFSDQQKEQLKSINSDYHKKLMDLKKHDEITVKEFKSQMGALHAAHKAQIQALLTPEQKEQSAKMKERGMQMAKVNAGARAEKMKIKLALTDAQASQLKNVRTDMMVKMKSIHTDNSLSQEQKHEQIKTLVTQQKDQLKTILTPDQLQQLEQMRSQHHRRDFSR
jgi:Spy/CpxP family protein refolding chaperone